MQNSLSSPQKSVQKTQHAQMNDRENIPNTCHTVTVVSYQHFATISKDLNSYGGGGSRPPSNTWLLGPTAPHTPNAISIKPAISSGLTLHYPYTLLWDGLFDPYTKIALSPGGSRPQSNTWLLWPTPPHMPNGISIGPAVFAGYLAAASQTDTHPHTDHVTRQQ